MCGHRAVPSGLRFRRPVFCPPGLLPPGFPLSSVFFHFLLLLSLFRFLLVLIAVPIPTPFPSSPAFPLPGFYWPSLPPFALPSVSVIPAADFPGLLLFAPSPGTAAPAVDCFPPPFASGYLFRPFFRIPLSARSAVCSFCQNNIRTPLAWAVPE